MLSATSNVLIGSNGAGKSSFLQVFSLLQRMATGRLQVHVGQCGGPDALLWYGARKTQQLAMDITFADGRIYSCTLEPTRTTASSIRRNVYRIARKTLFSGMQAISNHALLRTASVTKAFRFLLP